VFALFFDLDQTLMPQWLTAACKVTIADKQCGCCTADSTASCGVLRPASSAQHAWLRHLAAATELAVASKSRLSAEVQSTGDSPRLSVVTCAVDCLSLLSRKAVCSTCTAGVMSTCAFPVPVLRQPRFLCSCVVNTFGGCQGSCKLLCSLFRGFCVYVAVGVSLGFCSLGVWQHGSTRSQCSCALDNQACWLGAFPHSTDTSIVCKAPQRVRCGADAKMVWLTRIDYYS
jgi:hypothetical protein